jgi:AcrR family transcriptional regulator
MARAARPRLPAQERERHLLHAATKVFARSNYRVASTAEIGAAAGIAEPTVFKYFPTKKSLFLRILGGTGKAILRSWQRLASPEATGIETLQRIGDAYIEGVRRHTDELKVQFQALAESDDPDFALVLRENHEGYVRFFADAIEKGMRDGTIRRDVDPEAMAWLLNSVGFTSTLLRLLGFGHETGERQYRAMMNACLGFLAAPPGPSAPA